MSLFKKKSVDEQLKEIEEKKAIVEKRIAIDQKLVDSRKTLNEEKKKLKELEAEVKHPLLHEVSKNLAVAERNLVALSTKKLKQVK